MEVQVSSGLALNGVEVSSESRSYRSPGLISSELALIGVKVSSESRFYGSPGLISVSSHCSQSLNLIGVKVLWKFRSHQSYVSLESRFHGRPVSLELALVGVEVSLELRFYGTPGLII